MSGFIPISIKNERCPENAENCIFIKIILRVKLNLRFTIYLNKNLFGEFGRIIFTDWAWRAYFLFYTLLKKDKKDKNSKKN